MKISNNWKLFLLIYKNSYFLRNLYASFFCASSFFLRIDSFKTLSDYVFLLGFVFLQMVIIMFIPPKTPTTVSSFLFSKQFMMFVKKNPLFLFVTYCIINFVLYGLIFYLMFYAWSTLGFDWPLHNAAFPVFSIIQAFIFSIIGAILLFFCDRR